MKKYKDYAITILGTLIKAWLIIIPITAFGSVILTGEPKAMCYRVFELGMVTFFGLSMLTITILLVWVLIQLTNAAMESLKHF